MVRPRALVVHTRTLQAGREFEPSMRFRHLRNFILGSTSYPIICLVCAAGTPVGRSRHVGTCMHAPSLALVIDYSDYLDDDCGIAGIRCR